MKEMYCDISKKLIALRHASADSIKMPENFYFNEFLFQNNLKKQDVLLIDGKDMSQDSLKISLDAFKSKKILLIEKSGFLDERMCYIKNITKIKIK